VYLFYISDYINQFIYASPRTHLLCISDFFQVVWDVLLLTGSKLTRGETPFLRFSLAEALVRMSTVTSPTPISDSNVDIYSNLPNHLRILLSVIESSVSVPGLSGSPSPVQANNRYVYIHLRMCIYVNEHIIPFTYMYKCLYIIDTCTFVYNLYIYVYIRKYIYIYIYIYTYIYIHIYI
jgi:hypothetical protein